MLTLDQLLAQIRYDFDQHTVRVFAIGYEAAEATEVLKQNSELTQGRYYEGKQTNIREIFKDISAFFFEFELLSLNALNLANSFYYARNVAA
jgi:hypothetical protein